MAGRYMVSIGVRKAPVTVSILARLNGRALLQPSAYAGGG